MPSTDYILGNAQGVVIAVHHGAHDPPRTSAGPVTRCITDVAAYQAMPADERRAAASPLAKTVTATEPAECAKFAKRTDYDPSEITQGVALAFPRVKRDALLTNTDRWGAADFRARQATGKVAAWDAYRQALRDLTANTPDPWAVTWPSAPV